MVKLKDIRIGSTVKLRGDFGGGKVIKGVVTSVEKDIKNGYPGIDYEIDGRGYWAYLDQIESVIKY